MRRWIMILALWSAPAAASAFELTPKAQAALERGQAYAEHQGIMIRSGHSLEMLAKADVFVIDQAALRPESGGVTSRLRELGRIPLMISSDSSDVVQAAAAGLRIAPDRVYAEALPHDLPRPERRETVLAIFRDSADGERFDPFTAEEKARLRAAYARDLERIAALDPDILIRAGG